MMKQTKLAKAIAYTIAGVALTAGPMSTASATVTTMYNLTTWAGRDNSTNTEYPEDTLGNDTDGWIYGKGASAKDPLATKAKWAGTTGVNHAPLSYTGAHLNWAVEITGGKGGSGEISTYDSFDRYGIYADVDTAKGAWSDTSETGAQGWHHDLEFGLFKSDTSGTVSLSAEGILQSNTAFGFTIFKGMNTNGSYYHHAPWNAGNNANGLTSASIPTETSFTIADIVAYSVGGNAPQNLNTISFDAEAGQTYTIVLGGYRSGGWNESNDYYRLSVSQVPVPGAAWLFGSALTGFIGVRRRKSRVV
ncbi:MAG: VPLPA-CTERM sorting domain-containing protein [Methylomonas sp.]|nr:VPLPA-CTERM sorting domain-containing protein [Methylomonas sp.]